MPLPPKDDPRRPLHLAVRSMRLLGGLLLLFSTCVSSMFVIRGGGIRAGSFFVVGLMFYFLPGACLIVFSIFLARRRPWAVVAAICVASVMLLVALLGLGGIAIATALDFEPLLLVPLGVASLVVLALAQLVYHLARSFEAIRYTPPEERGFEPIMVTPLPASEMYPQRDERHDPPAA